MHLEVQESCFERLKHHIEGALRHNLATQSMEDVEKRLKDGTFQMWAAEDAIVITEICRMPSRSFLNISLGGGQLQQVKQLVEKVENYAKEQSFDGVLIIGRRGWLRALDGYKHAATVCVKEF